MKFGAGHCAPVAGEIRMFSVQDIKDVLFFEDLNAVAEAGCVAVAQDAVRFMEEEAEKAGLNDWRGGDGKLGEPHVGFARDVRESLQGVVVV